MPHPERVHALVDAFVGELHPDVERPVPVHAALKDLGIDSLSLVDLLLRLEREIGLEIPDEALPSISTVKDLMDHLEAAEAP